MSLGYGKLNLRTVFLDSDMSAAAHDVVECEGEER